MTFYYYTSHITLFYNFKAIAENDSYRLRENPAQNSTVKMYGMNVNSVIYYEPRMTTAFTGD